jgi:hypothetical protein
VEWTDLRSLAVFEQEGQLRLGRAEAANRLEHRRLVALVLVVEGARLRS